MLELYFQPRARDGGVDAFGQVASSSGTATTLLAPANVWSSRIGSLKPPDCFRPRLRRSQSRARASAVGAPCSFWRATRRATVRPSRPASAIRRAQQTSSSHDRLPARGKFSGQGRNASSPLQFLLPACSIEARWTAKLFLLPLPVSALVRGGPRATVARSRS